MPKPGSRMTAAATAIVTAVLLAAAPLPASAGDLTVTVAGVADDQGTVRIALYADAAGFLKDGHAVAAAWRLARSGTLRFSFRDLPAGRYAASVFHDADGDGELATNLFGAPTEGTAFTNDAHGSFGPPGFDAVAVSVAAEGETRATATMNY